MDGGQHTNFKGLLSYPIPAAGAWKTQMSTVSILTCQFAKPKQAKRLEEV